MTKQYTIQIDWVHEGYEPIAYRVPKPGEYILCRDTNCIVAANHRLPVPAFIVKKNRASLDSAGKDERYI